MFIPKVTTEREYNSNDYMLENNTFHPKLLSTLKDYSWIAFLQDLSSGVVVGIMALPLAIAFGIASGVRPQDGLVTAIIAGFLISFFGGSRVQIGGPTGAFIVVVYGIIQQFGYSGLLVCTFFAGILLILMGLFKVGDWVKFIPSPVITGFTSGIAVVIFSSQINDFFGLKLEKVPAHFLTQWSIYFRHWNQINYYALAIAMLTVVTMFVVSKKWPRIPSAFIALVLSTFIVLGLDLPVETIGIRFGAFYGSIPAPVFPSVDWVHIQSFIPSIFTIAMLGAIESLLSAEVADGMIGGKHRSNTELIAQGIANMVAPLFGGIPATGAIARTATNVRNGARTPIAGIIHSFVLFIIFVYGSHYASFIPMAALAGVLIVVSYNMSEWREFKTLLHSPKHDVMILLVTFFLTVIFDLTLAIEVGLVLASFLFVKRMSDSSKVNLISDEMIESDYDTYFSRSDSLERRKIPHNVMAMEISGAFFFGAASKFENTLKKYAREKEYIILRMNRVVTIDVTGIKTLARLVEDLKKMNVEVYLCDVSRECKTMIKESDVSKRLSGSIRSTIAATLAEVLSRKTDR